MSPEPQTPYTLNPKPEPGLQRQAMRQATSQSTDAASMLNESGAEMGFRAEGVGFGV